MTQLENGQRVFYMRSDLFNAVNGLTPVQEHCSEQDYMIAHFGKFFLRTHYQIQSQGSRLNSQIPKIYYLRHGTTFRLRN